MITVQEINSLRFYQGDISRYIINTTEEYNRYNSQFYQTKSAYHIINMLLYPGIENEKARIYYEKKKVPLNLLNDIEELFEVYENIFKAMCKYQGLKKRQGIIHAYRKDRLQSMGIIENDYLYSITSCSLKDESEEYFLKKNGILLLEFDIPTSVPFIILNDVLGVNSFQYQEELLLPPFLAFTKSVVDFTEKEWEYKDINNEPPKAKYLLKITKPIMSEMGRYNRIEIENDAIKVTEEIAYIRTILEKLSEGYIIQDHEKVKYNNSKNKIQMLIQELFFNIYKSFYGE